MNDKTQKQGSMLILAALAALFLFSCKNPLVGLGPRVDLNPPEGEVTGITNGDYVSGDITLTGTAEDDKELAAVWASIDGSDISGSFDADGNWEIDIDTTTYTDGEREVVISLKDASGKITEKQMLLFLDNTPPVIIVTSPDLSSPQDTSTISIRGEAYDPLRLKEVRATIGQGNIDTISTLKGTNDSWLFDISHSVSGTETLGIILEAEDEAGNVSQAVFHSNDLRYLNNDSSINIIDLYNLVDDQDLNTFYGTTGYIITPTDVDQATVHSGLPSGSTSSHLSFGAGISGLPLDVDMSGDIPQITVTTPNPIIIAPGDIMGRDSKVSGTVTDNVEVDETTVEIRFLEDDKTTEAITWAPVTIPIEQVLNNGKNVNFSYPLPVDITAAEYLTAGYYYVEVRADDTNGTEGQTASIPFQLDLDAPSIEITSPALSSYIPDTGTLIEGNATDGEPILVEISLDGTNWDTVTTLPAPGGSWSYQISDWETVPGAGSFSDFDTIPISARAKAGGKTTYTYHSLILDSVAPTVEFLTPDDSRDEFGVITGDVNGVVTLRVAVSDDSLDSVTHKIGINGPVEAVDSGSLYNWSEIVVTTLMEDPNLATEISPGIWELPVTVTAVDKAGNTTVTADYTMIIDNAQDRPNISVIYPIEGESYGGEVSVSGIATDDDGTVGAVKVQVDLNTPPAGTPDFDDVYTFVDGIDFDGTGAVTVVDESVAYQVTGLSSWSFPLNTTGELYSTDAYTPGSGHNGDVYVKIWAVDPITSSVTSVPQTLHFRFDDTLPRVDSVEIDGSPVSSNAYVSGTVVMDVTVSDDTQINKLEISYDNGVSWEDQSVTPAMSILESISIDTAARVAGGNGILYLRIKATDNTGYTTLEVLPLNVDNNAPEGTYPGVEPIVLTGTESLLQGTASDPNGSIAGVDRIEVFLERGGSLYDPLSLAYDYETNYPADIPAEESTFGAGNYYPVDPVGAGVMVIDDVNELGVDAPPIGDDDGYNESLTLVASTWNWWVKFDSENIPDGDITIHYVVVDKAGNKTHYDKAARIENNPPVIESVRLGTDINYDTAVDTTVGDGETFRFIDGSGTDGSGIYYVDFSSSFTGITARNNRLFVDADESASDGNGDPSAWLWELLYKGAAPNLFGVGIDSATISDFSTPSMPDEVGVVYTLRVTDDAGLSDEVDIVIDLDNDDTADPTVTLYDLDLAHSAIIDARDGLGDGDGYAIPGYDPTASPAWASAAGRLHAAGSGLYDGTDADASGTIVVSGTVEDDKAINELELQISGYNGGLGAGNPFPILVWDGSANGGLGGLTTAGSVIGTPHISSESYGESSGHVVSWSFEFDSSTITNGAAANVRVTAVATDKSSNTNTPVDDFTSDNYTVDVMPFITDVVISDASYVSSNEILRTRYGAWPIREGAYLRINGFNLGNVVGTVPSSSGDPTVSDLSAAYSAFTGISVDLPGRQEVTAQAAGIVNSGWLAMETGGIELMNYHGDIDENDSADSTWSTDGAWTDDRYLLVWDVADEMAGSDSAVWGAMDVDPTDGSLWGSWSEYSSARVYLANEGSLYNDGTGGTGIFYVYDPSEYTDVSVSEAGNPYVVQLNNFYGGSGNWNTGAGGLTLWGDNADLWNYVSAWNTDDPYGAREDVLAEEIERFSDDQELWQFKNPGFSPREPLQIPTFTYPTTMPIPRP
jgi:hypothetical protein